jgi:hypothetical protein
LADFTYRELEKCAAREVAMRRNVFRRLGDNENRRREVVMMEAIQAHFKHLADAEEAQVVIIDTLSGGLSKD